MEFCLASGPIRCALTKVETSAVLPFFLGILNIPVRVIRCPASSTLPYMRSRKSSCSGSKAISFPT